MNLKKAEKLSGQYLGEKFKFLTGYVEGYRNFKATESGDVYDEGRRIGQRDALKKGLEIEN